MAISFLQLFFLISQPKQLEGLTQIFFEDAFRQVSYEF